MNSFKPRWIVLIGLVFVMATMFSVMAQSSGFNASHAQAVPGLSAAEYHGKALELMSQADNTYNPDFFDQTGWQVAVAYAEAAVNAEPSNTEYLRNLGEAYTKTQFWIEGYRVFKQLQDWGSLDPQAQGWAALCATKVGYIRLANNAPEEAVVYLQDALNWQYRPEVQALLQHAQSDKALALARR